MLKKSLSILFLSAFILDLAGIFVVFKIEQFNIRKEIKRQIKRGIDDDDLHLFSLTQKEYDELNWVREDIEFRSDSSMFDIVRLEKNRDSIFLYCVNDKEEAILFAQLDDMVKKKTEQNSNSPDSPANKVVKLFKLFNYVENINDSYQGIFTISRNVFIEKNVCYLLPFIAIDNPPPDTV